jgi:hypothetical protein
VYSVSLVFYQGRRARQVRAKSTRRDLKPAGAAEFGQN